MKFLSDMPANYNKMKCKICDCVGLVSATIRDMKTNKEIKVAECLECGALQYPEKG